MYPREIKPNKMSKSIKISEIVFCVYVVTQKKEEKERMLMAI
jgi:hypothetical protein